jgi:hypothetical protein
MQARIISLLAAIIALAWSIQSAQAGAIRTAARELHKGSIAAVQKTSEAAGAATGSVANAGKTGRAALKNGTAALRKDAASAPSMAVLGAKSAAGKIWKAVW